MAGFPPEDVRHMFIKTAAFVYLALKLLLVSVATKIDF